MIPSEAIEKLIQREGGFTDNANDSGGATKYGITEKVARENGYEGDMRDMPIEFARQVYKKKYWDVLRLDDVAQASQPIALEVFDTFVNTGQRGQFLQRALNALNRQQRDYVDIVVDGDVGVATLSALHSFIGRRGADGERVMLACLNAQLVVYYLELVERRYKDEEFFFGWILNRVVLAA
jgi:lysozyme family protein